MLELQITLVTEVVRSVRLAHHHDVLNADAEAPIGVVSGFYATVRMLLNGVRWHLPSETVIPDLSGVLLYATGVVRPLYTK